MKRIQIHVEEIMISFSRHQVNTLLRNERSDVLNFNMYTNLRGCLFFLDLLWVVTNEEEHNYICIVDVVLHSSKTFKNIKGQKKIVDKQAVMETHKRMCL